MGAGNISDRIYDGQCFFADPTVKFSGLERWKGNLKLLVPFLVEPKIQMLKLERDTQASSVLHVSLSANCHCAHTACVAQYSLIHLPAGSKIMHIV